MKFGVCILVGGKSSRMNFNSKADLVYNGKTFLEILTEEFQFFSNKFLSINTKQNYHLKGYTNIVDEYEEIGPMSGIVSTFHQSDVDALFVCSCDMPFVKKEMVEFLFEQLDGYDCIFFEDANHTYLTAGIYTRKMLPILETQIQKKDYRLYRCVKLSNMKILKVEECMIDPSYLRNINTLEEYQTLES